MNPDQVRRAYRPSGGRSSTDRAAARRERYERDRARAGRSVAHDAASPDRVGRSGQRSGQAGRAGRDARAERMDRAGRQERQDRGMRQDRAGRADRRGTGNPERMGRTGAMGAGALGAAGPGRSARAANRTSYGNARDYARQADNLDRQDYDGLGRPTGNRPRDRRPGDYPGPGYDYAEYDDFDGGRSGRDGRSGRHERDDYDDRGQRQVERSADHRRGRHAEHDSRDIYVRHGAGPGGSIGASLLFGSGGGDQAGGLHFGNSPALPRPVAYALPVVVLILIILLIVFIVTSVQSCSAGSQQEEPQETVEQPLSISFAPSVAGLDGLANPGTTVSGFTLAGEGANYMPTLSEDGQAQIQSALAPFAQNDYDLGFMIMDLQTGSGYAYNVDQQVYGASSFKGPVLIYGCQEALEPGILSISTVDDAASNAIIYSDNNSYYRMRALFEEYSETSLANWLQGMSIDADVSEDTSFPHYTARDSAKLWMDAYLYFTAADSDPEIVAWAQNLMSSTQVSMLRAGVDPTFALVTDGGNVYYQGAATQNATDGSAQGSDQGAGDQSGQSDQSGQAAQGDDPNVPGDQSGQTNQGDDPNVPGDQSNETGTTDGQDGSNGDGSDQDGSADSSEDGSADGANGDGSGEEGDSSEPITTEPTESGIRVYDKAGWLNGETDDGLCDAGIVIDSNGKAYLITVMSGAPDSDENRQNLMNLVGALWAQRASLEPEQGYTLVDAAQTSADSSADGNADGSADANADAGADASASNDASGDKANA